ncbi:hypothetical protein V5799_020724 [Amblyomma americanum]|uniref:carbonic anhydrase n=1 Tax=Amblyomma americanum TaxID=6943 RepID=A0AAQ4ETL2_AMBAM
MEVARHGATLSTPVLTPSVELVSCLCTGADNQIVRPVSLLRPAMDGGRLALVLIWLITAVQGMVHERWHYYVPRCHVPGPQPIIPREWGQEWSSCNGAKQSPVLLLPHKSIGIEVPPLHFKHFSTPLANPVIANTGRTLRVRSSMPKPIVTGGILTEEYVFDQAEFHWGRDDHTGSEHIIDALSYAVEVQMTFRLRTPSARVDCKECPPAYVALSTQFKVRQLRQLYAFPEVFTCNRPLVANLRPLQEIGRTRMLYRTFSSAPTRLRLSFTTALASALISGGHIMRSLK